jgi:hypothetical protein
MLLLLLLLLLAIESTRTGVIAAAVKAARLCVEQRRALSEMPVDSRGSMREKGASEPRQSMHVLSRGCKKQDAHP